MFRQDPCTDVRHLAALAIAGTVVDRRERLSFGHRLSRTTPRHHLNYGACSGGAG
jgi:hypothetical protein